MLTIPSDKPQIHYTICKMGKKPLHNRYIFIIISFRISNQNFLFFSPTVLQAIFSQFHPSHAFFQLKKRDIYKGIS